MNKPPFFYQIPEAKWTLEFSAQALDVFRGHVQAGRSSKESVGQLYVRELTVSRLVVELATSLAPKWATFSRVRFDTRRATAERDAQFAEGLHCVGLWHTHPEPRPCPSPEDLRLAKDHAEAAKPQLAGIIFVIVGTLPFPDGLLVSVHDGECLRAATAHKQV